MFHNFYNIDNESNNSSSDEEEDKINNLSKIKEHENIFPDNILIENLVNNIIENIINNVQNIDSDSKYLEKLESFENSFNLENSLNDDEVEEDEEDNKKYIEPKILDNICLTNFFSKEDVSIAKKNNKKLLITDKGLYSITKSDDAVWITNLILKFMKSETNINPKFSSIIDSTSGIGGNSVHFAKYFNIVNSIEINEVHFNVLKNNVEALNIKNINLYHNNFMNMIQDKNKIKGDIFFIDPPWGGKSYKNFKYFFLKIGKLPLTNVLNILYDNKYKYVVLKAPYNLNISLLVGSIKYENMNIHKNLKKNMLIIIFY